MSFSSTVKDELIRRMPQGRCCMLAELAAFIRASGSIHITTGEKGGISLQVQSENSGVARKLFLLFKEAFNIHPEITCHKRIRLGRGNLYVLRISGEAIVKDILSALHLMKEGGLWFNSGIPWELLSSDCCRRTYISALFVAAGSIVTPEKTYHLEIIVDEQEYAAAILELFQGYDVRFRVSQRKGKWVLYLKGAEGIIQFLAAVEVHGAILDLENVRVMKDVRNQINRLVNCETANLSKAAYAALEQIADIKFIEERLGLHNLPQSLQETARLRLEHPYMNMRELAEAHSLPLSKSGVNYRIRRLRRIAARLRSES